MKKIGRVNAPLKWPTYWGHSMLDMETRERFREQSIAGKNQSSIRQNLPIWSLPFNATMILDNI